MSRTRPRCGGEHRPRGGLSPEPGSSFSARRATRWSRRPRRDLDPTDARGRCSRRSAVPGSRSSSRGRRAGRPLGQGGAARRRSPRPRSPPARRWARCAPIRAGDRLRAALGEACAVAAADGVSLDPAGQWAIIEALPQTSPPRLPATPRPAVRPSSTRSPASVVRAAKRLGCPSPEPRGASRRSTARGWARRMTLDVRPASGTCAGGRPVGRDGRWSSERLVGRVVVGVSAAYALAVGTLALLRYERFASDFDHGIFTQYVWLLGHLHEPFNTVVLRTLLGDHVEPGSLSSLRSGRSESAARGSSSCRRSRSPRPRRCSTSSRVSTAHRVDRRRAGAPLVRVSGRAAPRAPRLPS